MYTVVVRCYEAADRTRYYGEMYEGSPKDTDCLMSAHLDGEATVNDLDEKHQQILSGVRAVCDELAQNLEDTLF